MICDSQRSRVANRTNHKSPITNRIVYHSWLSLSDLFSRRRKDEPDAADGGADSPVHPTKALAKFLVEPERQAAAAAARPRSGRRHQRHVLRRRARLQDPRREYLQGHRSPHHGGQARGAAGVLREAILAGSGSVDGILCWDVFDYLDRPAAQALARAARSRSCGLTARCSRCSPPPSRRRRTAPIYTKYVVVDRQTLQYRPYPAARGKQRPLLNRDIQRMFEPLRITEQFLLKNNLREVLFRKPARRRATRRARRTLAAQAMARPVIALLTDFGTRDHYAARCAASRSASVPTRRSSTSRTRLPPQDVLGGALELAVGVQVLSATARSFSASWIRASDRRGAASPRRRRLSSSSRPTTVC